MRHSFSDINLEISQILNRAMQEFDEMPGTSGSAFAEAASRDLIRISANFRFVRLAVFLCLVIFFWEIKDLSSAIAVMFSWAHVVVEPMTVMSLILTSLFVGGWIALIKYVSYVKRRNFQMMSEVERDLVQSVKTLADALPKECGMLTQNLLELAQRMLKVFPKNEKESASELTRVTLAVFSEEVCSALSFNDICAEAVTRVKQLLKRQSSDLVVA